MAMMSFNVLALSLLTQFLLSFLRQVWLNDLVNPNLRCMFKKARGNSILDFTRYFNHEVYQLTEFLDLTWSRSTQDCMTDRSKRQQDRMEVVVPVASVRFSFVPFFRELGKNHYQTMHELSWRIHFHSCA